MLIEVEPMTNLPVVITGIVGKDVGEASVGMKRFDVGTGAVTYEWFAEYLSRDDLIAFAEALLFVARHAEE